jgi:hypothetical protein
MSDDKAIGLLRRAASAARRMGDTFSVHRFKIAADTLLLSDAVALVMGRPSKAEARELAREIEFGND